jgi:hypothetical protein
MAAHAHSQHSLRRDADYHINMTAIAGATKHVQDIRFVVPMKETVVKWMMGLNVMPSGKFNSPVEFSWNEYVSYSAPYA